VFLNWFLSRGTGCGADCTGSMPAKMPDKMQWRELFGDINPNSALPWRDGGITRVLEFEQSRPRLNRATGRWSAKIRPLADDVMHSTNSVEYSGEYWVVETISRSATSSRPRPSGCS